ncbi:hypothetical protein OCGS_2137 [Oceaniovalibus guishaninsula JLT2003]|uniref:Nucleotidyltransferase n=1 Tax=Oceaniovalibus guishaninsula JLT2003 TaxID=1231392 RepID=K2H847_9RHOB|nr:nucleotidyltransferase domain-containing protein [Oceaniovalibus guishaninsula]EKE43803.1 hypothetical protein OCGS_2137 [Oceaniovalibus guishaninsula JLT2003]
MKGPADAPVSDAMRATIGRVLDALAEEERIGIVMAIESGSRAWGFHSPDSDYDVRFVYARPVDWHLSLARKRDVIERPISDELDVSGWDLSKALKLSMNANAVLSEWLQSPILYAADAEGLPLLRDFAARAMRRRPVTWHYLSIAFRHLERLDPDKPVPLKRFFYTVRPALALRWMRLNGGAVPPMDMAALREGCDLPPRTAALLDDLTERKRAVREKASAGPVDRALLDLVGTEMGAARAWLAAAGPDRPDPALWAEADTLYRRLVRKVGE